MVFWSRNSQTTQTTRFSDRLDHLEDQFSLDRSQNFDDLFFWSTENWDSQTTSFSEQNSRILKPWSKILKLWQKVGKCWQIEEILTWDGRWGVETRSDVLIHRNSKVTILNDLSIALVDAEFDPVNEWFACNRGKDVANPLLWGLSQLFSARQVSVHLCILVEMREDLLEAEVLVGWHSDVDNRSHLDVCQWWDCGFFNLHFFLPLSKSFRKYTVRVCDAGK